MQLFRYTAAQADDFYNIFFTMPDASNADPFIAWKVHRGDHPHATTASDLGNTTIDDATVLAGLMSLAWQPATDVPPPLLDHPQLPENPKNPRWQTAEVSSNFLSLLAGHPMEGPLVKRSKGVDGIQLIIILLVGVAIWYFGFSDQ